MWLRRVTCAVSFAAGLIWYFVPLSTAILLLRIRGQKHRKRSEQNGTIRLLRLIEGGDLESIYRKFRNLDQYFLHLIPEETSLVVGSNWGTGNDFELRLRDDYVLVETRYLYRWAGWSAVRFLYRHLQLIRRYRLHLIHANSPYVCGLFGMILSRLAGLPLCVSIHADYEKREELQGNVIPRILDSLWLSRLCERTVYRQASSVLPIRASMRPHLESCGCPPEKIRVFPHGLQPEPAEGVAERHENVREILGIPDGARLICSACRIEKENFCDDLIRLYQELVARHRDVVCVLCGDGSQRERLKEHVAQRGLSDRILLPGAVAHVHVQTLFRESVFNVCLMGGFSLIEACAAARPVIAYDCEWHDELVRDGETGFLIAEGDVPAAVTQAERLLADATLADRLGKAARKLVTENFSWQATCRKKSQIYRELVHV